MRQDRSEVEILAIQLHLTRFYFREIQNVADDPEQGIAGIAHLSHQLPLVFTEGLPFKQLGKSNHGIHGSPQFMAHLREELTLGRTRSLQLGGAFLDLLLQGGIQIENLLMGILQVLVASAECIREVQRIFQQRLGFCILLLKGLGGLRQLANFIITLIFGDTGTALTPRQTGESVGEANNGPADALANHEENQKKQRHQNKPRPQKPLVDTIDVPENGLFSAAHLPAHSLRQLPRLVKNFIGFSRHHHIDQI